MIKKIIATAVLLLTVMTSIYGIEKLSLKDITGSTFAPRTLSAVTPLADGESYAQISHDRKNIVVYSFKTGKETSRLFSVENLNVEGISSIDNYMLNGDGKRMLIQTNTEYIYRRSFKADFYVYDLKTRKCRQLSANGRQQNPVWSPDGSKIAFVRDNNIYCVDLNDGYRETQVTADGKFNEIINGIPDWVNEEEFGFSSAMVFNADGTKICWIRYDESKVETYALQMFKGLKPELQENAAYPGEYAYKYPKAGHDNSVVTAWCYDIATKQKMQFKLPLAADGYIPRIKQSADKQSIFLYTMNRHQDELKIYEANLATADCRLVIDERIDKYVTEEAMSSVIITPKHIILPSDRSGKKQLYLYDLSGKLIRQLTDGKSVVTAVYGYDEKSGKVYYQAAGKNPMNREVYVADAKGRTSVIAGKDGWNSAIFSSNYSYFVKVWSDCNTPYQYTLCKGDGKELKTMVDNAELAEKLAGCNLPRKEFFQFTTSEGISLNGVMIKPVDFDETKKYPVVMYQYSGPGSQQVVNSWSIGSMGQGGLYDQYLTQLGFIVVCVDGRGTGARGADFEKCTYLRLGELEARDQVETAVYLGTLPYVDKEKIGIWGWSFGGFCTLMSMSEGREVFAAGVAVAPPTDWRYYDSVYTERFMRTPQENAEGYDINPINRADKLHGALLVCHGLADDNVHPQNAFEYSEALVQADKDFRELIYTNRNHGIRGGNSRNHLLRQITTHFVNELIEKK